MKLLVPDFEERGGIERVVAESDGPSVLRMQVLGDEKSLRAVALRMLAGPIDAVLRGRPIRMRHFSVQNQGDRQRIVMDVQYEEHGRHGHDQRPHAGRPATE